MKNKLGIWFYGLSGVGKTYASNYIFSNDNHKSIIIDGDVVRELISIDLGYSIKEREKQINRIFGIAKIALKSKLFPIISSVYMNKSLLEKAEIENILVIKIERQQVAAKKNNKTYNENKDIVGIDLDYEVFRTIEIHNSGDIEFCKQLDLLIN